MLIKNVQFNKLSSDRTWTEGGKGDGGRDKGGVRAVELRMLS